MGNVPSFGLACLTTTTERTVCVSTAMPCWWECRPRLAHWPLALTGGAPSWRLVWHHHCDITISLSVLGLCMNVHVCPMFAHFSEMFFCFKPCKIVGFCAVRTTPQHKNKKCVKLAILQNSTTEKKKEKQSDIPEKSQKLAFSPECSNFWVESCRKLMLSSSLSVVTIETSLASSREQCDL